MVAAAVACNLIFDLTVGNFHVLEFEKITMLNSDRTHSIRDVILVCKIDYLLLVKPILTD